MRICIAQKDIEDESFSELSSQSLPGCCVCQEAGDLVGLRGIV
jgi:hypothetical protein